MEQSVETDERFALKNETENEINLEMSAKAAGGFSAQSPTTVRKRFSTGILTGEHPIRLRYKIIAYIATWTAALLLTAPSMWSLAFMFPLGLVAVIDRHLANDGGWGVLIGCYVLYVVHAFFFFRSKTTLRTSILYGVLVILLIGNVAGCREMIHPH